MDNWLMNLLETKGIVKEAALDLTKEDRADVIKADWDRQIAHMSDHNLAEKITELELEGKGLPEQYNKRIEEVLKTVKNSRKSAEAQLKKLVGTHSKLQEEKIFEGLNRESARTVTLADYAREVIASTGHPYTILNHTEARKKVISKEQFEKEIIELNAVLSDTAVRQSAKLFNNFLVDNSIDFDKPEDIKTAWNNFLKMTNLALEGERIKDFIDNSAIKEAIE